LKQRQLRETRLPLPHPLCLEQESLERQKIELRLERQ
jgi:hypothetical protein